MTLRREKKLTGQIVDHFYRTMRKIEVLASLLKFEECSRVDLSYKRQQL